MAKKATKITAPAGSTAGNIPRHFHETELWALFVRKAQSEGRSTDGLLHFCKKAETLSNRIIENYKYFTLHDHTHSAGVCKWMYLLLGDKAERITTAEAALLLMSACSHDLGMLIQDESELKAQARCNYGDWEAYFNRHPDDRAKLDTAECHDVIVSYVRENHHRRLRVVMPKIELALDDSFYRTWGINAELLASVCQSHGEELGDLGKNTDGLDANLCAVLLRLADALDYDSNRAPDILMQILNLDDEALLKEGQSKDEKADAEWEKSIKEWRKNRAGVFERSKEAPMRIAYRAACYWPEIHAELNDYLRWLGKELERCYEFVDSKCAKFSGENNPIPHFLKAKIDPKGYDSAEIRLMMDQNRVLELLSGEELYGDRGVFVRELLQNSIDAVLMRCESDGGFSVENGEIKIDAWSDEADGRYCWFRIRDNGIGMDRNIVKNYFLNVGRSYYNDKDGYLKDLLAQGKRDPGFKPISRFGIGILSCFMGEGRNNRLEVSTRRFSPYNKDIKPIRLDVTGLDGYYYLTELSEVKQGRPMPKPPREDAEYEYMRDYGTTICLRLDQYMLPAVSFRELLDRYIRFPRVRISFCDHRTAEEKIYPTQHELEELLDRLNPDFDKTGEATPHVHRLSEAAFEAIKKEFSEYDWSKAECPELILEYWPLHRMGLSNQLGGALIRFNYRATAMAHTSILLVERTEGVPVTLNMTNTFRGGRYEVSLGIEFDYDYDYAYYSVEVGAYRSEFNHRSSALSVPLAYALTEDEKALHRLLSFVDDRSLCSAYNGIKCGDDMERVESRGIVLLAGDYRPEVTLSREAIRSLPFEAACDAALQYDRMELSFPYQSDNFRSTPASAFYDFIDRHGLLKEAAGNWTALHLQRRVFEYISADNEYLFLLGWSNTDSIAAAAGKKAGLSLVFGYDNLLRFKKRDEAQAADPDGAFPPTLFADSYEADGFGRVSIFGGSFNIFSPAHPFSKWLTENRALLQKEAASVYRRLIDCMVSGRDPKELTRALNAELDQLRSLPNNPFRVPHDLRIEDGEIKEY